MKSLKLFFLVALMAISLYATHAAGDEMNSQEDATMDEVSDDLRPTSRRGANRILSNFQFLHKRMTCNKYPRICWAKGSAGPDCCKKKCVNVDTDRYNCGRCGKKCKYSEICCKGKCVNPMFNKKHCGGCNSECSKGSFCVYGMCGYA